MAVENIVAEDEAGAVAGEELLTEEKGLGQAVGFGLDLVAEADAELRAVAEQLLEARQILGGGDEQNLAQAGQHQGREGIIDHRLVVDGQ